MRDEPIYSAIIEGINLGDCKVPWESVSSYPYEGWEPHVWWCEEVLGYKPKIDVYDEKREYTSEEQDAYDDERYAFIAANQVPFDTIRHGFGERYGSPFADPVMWFIAIKETVILATLGEPILLDGTLPVGNDTGSKLINDFIEKHIVPLNPGLKRTPLGLHLVTGAELFRWHHSALEETESDET